MSEEQRRGNKPEAPPREAPPEPAQPAHRALLQAQLTVCDALQGLKPDDQRRVLNAVFVTLGLKIGDTARATNNNTRPAQQRTNGAR